MSNGFKKFLFYFLNLTWGFPITFVGAILALGAMIMGYKPHRHGGCIYFNIGQNWGGFEMGLFFFTDDSDDVDVKNHEFGHAIQTCVFGVFEWFIVSIPSAVRYWYREFKYYRKNKYPPTDYDSVWFEGSATKLGNKYIELWNK